MGYLLRLGVSLLVGAVLGGGTALWAANSFLGFASKTYGSWRTSSVIGSQAADPYTRTAIAIGGLLALNKSETVYFTATVDDTGAPLDGKCHYRVVGRKLPARWWSITAYGDDFFLIPNADKKYSFTKQDFEALGTDEFNVVLAANPASSPAIPLGEAASFSLTLRLYNPTIAVYETITQDELPRIEKDLCP